MMIRRTHPLFVLGLAAWLAAGAAFARQNLSFAHPDAESSRQNPFFVHPEAPSERPSPFFVYPGTASARQNLLFLQPATASARQDLLFLQRATACVRQDPSFLPPNAGSSRLDVVRLRERSVLSHPAAGPSRAAQEARKLKVCLLPKKKGLPYFTTCAKGAEEAARALGNIELIYDGPTDGSPEKAASMIERWALQGVDVIAVSPNDPNVLAPAMKKAREKGVHVITWDADGLPGTREFMVNQATPKDIGCALVDAMVADLGGEEATGEVAIVTATLTAANQNEWIGHMKERLRAYPKLSLVAVKPSNEDQRMAFQVTGDLMTAHPRLRGVFGISSVSFPGAAEAVKQAGKSGQILVTGLATPNDMKAFVHDGTVRTVVLWNTVDLGYLTVYAAEALATGKLKTGATGLPAGRLGEKKIDGDQILLGDILRFTRENIDAYDF